MAAAEHIIIGLKFLLVNGGWLWETQKILKQGLNHIWNQKSVQAYLASAEVYKNFRSAEKMIREHSLTTTAHVSVVLPNCCEQLWKISPGPISYEMKNEFMVEDWYSTIWNLEDQKTELEQLMV